MENLAYLYALAEADEQCTKKRKASFRGKQFQEGKHALAHAATLPCDAQAVDMDKAAIECDRAYQPYPTFYL